MAACDVRFRICISVRSSCVTAAASAMNYVYDEDIVLVVTCEHMNSLYSPTTRGK
jgi:hypothetical protein